MKAIIVGGGVAGTVSAIALSRAGADVTIYEAYDREGTGSWISLAVNGLRALDAVGVGERVRAAGFPVARQRLWSSAGRLLADVDRGRRAADPDRSVTLLRKRGALPRKTQAGSRFLPARRSCAGLGYQMQQNSRSGRWPFNGSETEYPWPASAPSRPSSSPVAP